MRFELALLLLATGALGFATGYAVRGVHLEQRPADTTSGPGEVSDHPDGGMLGNMVRRILGTVLRWLDRPSVTAILLVVALAVSAVGAFANVTAAAARDNDVACTIEYNRGTGVARDERDKAARASTRSELKLWRALREQLLTGTSVDPAVSAIDGRISKLEALQTARRAYEYPPPDECSDGEYNAPTQETGTP